MECFFCIILFIIISMVDGTKQIHKNNTRVEDNKRKAFKNGNIYYFDYNSNMRLLSNNRLIYRKTNDVKDICYYDSLTNQLVYNESKAERNKNKMNTIIQAQNNNLKFFEMPYVYKTKEGLDNQNCLSETVETATLQPFQLRYIPIKGYGFVMRKAPAINPNKLYDYNYKYDESKWSDWHIISKEKYVEISGKPIYEYTILKYCDLSKVVK